MLPNLLMIGVQKGGTTWLHRAMGAHPQIFMAAAKELVYFSQSPQSDVSEYEAHFADAGDALYRGESTPAYMSEVAGRRSAAKMARTVLGADIKVIVSFRHPVARAISGYLHHWKMGRLRGDELLSDTPEECAIESLGHYKSRLAPWLDAFPRSNFFFTTIEEIEARPSELMKRLFQFLGVREFTLPEEVMPPFHSGFGVAVNGNGDRLEVAANSTRKMNQRLSMAGGPVHKMRQDFVLPVMEESCIRRLEASFANDIAYVEGELFGRSLGWSGEKPLAYYST